MGRVGPVPPSPHAPSPVWIGSFIRAISEGPRRVKNRSTLHSPSASLALGARSGDNVNSVGRSIRPPRT
jgi:hypothetical protein